VWVDDDALLEELAAVLAPPDALALEPTIAEDEALRAAVAGRFPRLDWQPPRPRSRVWRALPLAAAGVLVPGTAAAAAGMPLPRPVRAVAHAVGLPVDSPALYDTYRHARQLHEAVEDQDHRKARETADKLRRDLSEVPADDRKEAHEAGLPALAEAAELLEVPVAPAAEPAPADPPTPTGDPASEPPATGPQPRPSATVETTVTTQPAEVEPAEETTTSTTEAPAVTETEQPPADDPSSTTTTATTTTDPDPAPSSSSSSTTTTTTVEETKPRS
jgi:hypothetical protein